MQDRTEIPSSTGRFKRLFKNLTPLIFNRPNAFKITGGVVLTWVGMGLNFLTPYVFGKSISMLASGESIDVKGYDITPLAMVGVYGSLWALSGQIANWRDIALAQLAPTATEKLVVNYTEHLMSQPLSYHLTTPVGIHQNRLAKCYGSMPTVTQIFTQLLPTGQEVIVAMAILSHWYDWKIGLSLGGVLVVYTGYNLATKNKVTKLREKALEEGLKIYGDWTSIVNHYEPIHIFNNLPYEMARLKQLLHTYNILDTSANAMISKISSGQTLIAGAGFLGICLLTANGVIKKQFTVGDFATISSFLVGFSAPLAGFGRTLNQLSAAMTELDLVFNEFYRYPLPLQPSKTLQIENKEAEIEFRNVSFNYDEDTPILSDVSFRVKARQKIGIVGASGAGKSTIGSLMFGFYKPQSGQILINGEDISEVSQASLRQVISVVQQTSVLFNDTLYNNVEYGGLSRKEGVKKTEVLEAIELARLGDFVESLSEELETMVGERGAKVSGGQRQRLAIARAYLKDPSIYIFDEATASLDTTTAGEIQENLDAVSKGKGRTSVHITHNLANLINADDIIVLKNGKIAETGTHAELIKIEGGVYAKLWQRQCEMSQSLEHKAEGAEVKLSDSAFTQFSTRRLSISKNESLPEVRIDIGRVYEI